jgi:hypothetical protein
MPKDKKSKAKKYKFSTDEFLFVSEHRSFMELHDSLIRRYIAAKVLPRLSVKTEGNFIRVSDDGNGIDVIPNDELSAVKSATPSKVTQPAPKASPEKSPK